MSPSQYLSATVSYLLTRDQEFLDHLMVFLWGDEGDKIYLVASEVRYVAWPISAGLRRIFFFRPIRQKCRFWTMGRPRVRCPFPVVSQGKRDEGHLIAGYLFIIMIMIMIIIIIISMQRAKKVLSDSLGLEDFSVGLMTFVLSLPDGQVKFFENSNHRRTVYSNLLIKELLGLVKVMFGLVHATCSYS